MSAQDAFEAEVSDAIRAARARGAKSFYDVLAFCEGSDPNLVARIYGADDDTGAPDRAEAVARRETSELAALFPAADPVACQWWYTLDTIDSLAIRAALPPACAWTTRMYPCSSRRCRAGANWPGEPKRLRSPRYRSRRLTESCARRWSQARMCSASAITGSAPMLPSATCACSRR
jgi:hypothetical protein